MQRVGIDLRRNSRQRKQRFCLGGEGEPARIAVDVDRLDAHTVAADDQPLAARVPQSEGEHAVQPMDELVAILSITVENDFAVRRGLEPVAQRNELPAQFAKIVDFAVANEPQRAAVVR